MVNDGARNDKRCLNFISLPLCEGFSLVGSILVLHLSPYDCFKSSAQSLNALQVSLSKGEHLRKLQLLSQPQKNGPLFPRFLLSSSPARLGRRGHLLTNWVQQRG